MSVGNLKTYGNKGNNFPYQLNTLKLASVSQLKNCSEITLNNATAAGLVTDINNYFITNFNYYLISKEIIYVGALYTAFLTISKIK